MGGAAAVLSSGLGRGLWLSALAPSEPWAAAAARAASKAEGGSAASEGRAGGKTAIAGGGGGVGVSQPEMRGDEASESGEG